MNINTSTGLLEDCTQCPSPNKDTRPENTGVDLVVIHSISLPPGEYGGNAIEQFFQNQLDKDQHPYFAEIHDLEVSSHLLIKRSGEIVQFVPFHERAWHAGQSNYKGRERCNDFSIGIELEGTDTDMFEDIQYAQLSRLIVSLKKTYPSISDNITGHCDIAPGRKQDPGSGFDWEKLKTQLDAVE
ncbi:MAG: 1,6-anhydro-N-acetylmuramyl-L-alanine amidase AmpD [Gammaproteobacteria bacterium]|nr:1,6-anhydro-N-acetylmuramyl-L-alanine amidase AmpD [Gammaproteobacteria bacterium]